MMKVTVCIGSSCHLKGSKSIVDLFRELIAKDHLEEKVELAATFCTGNCDKGVCVTVDGELFTVKPETAEEFFKNEIAARL